MNNSLVESEQIVFFDGVCNLCNSFIDFLIRHDTRNVLKFAPLQGSTAKERLPLSRVQTPGSSGPIFTSVVFLKDGIAHYSSDAALEIVAELGGVWSIARVFKILPRPLRDFVYRHIASNRYKWFGQKSSCRVPTPSERARFLD